MSTLRVDETERLQALRSYDVLDTDPEPCFDRITRLAAQAFQSPIAVIAFADRGRQWFKSEIGLGVREMSAQFGFCAQALLSSEPTVVLDPLGDHRFRDNPVVTGNTRIRFYAGAPLITATNHRVGTLCVMDTSTRLFVTNQQLSALQDLAAVAVSELEQRRLRRDAEHTITQLRLLEAVSHSSRACVEALL